MTLGHKLFLQPEASHSYPSPGRGDRCGWSRPTWASFSSLVMFKNICAISRSNTRTRSQSKRRDLSLSAFTCRKKDKRSVEERKYPGQFVASGELGQMELGLVWEENGLGSNVSEPYLRSPSTRKGCSDSWSPPEIRQMVS